MSKHLNPYETVFSVFTQTELGIKNKTLPNTLRTYQKIDIKSAVRYSHIRNNKKGIKAKLIIYHLFIEGFTAAYIVRTLDTPLQKQRTVR